MASEANHNTILESEEYRQFEGEARSRRMGCSQLLGLLILLLAIAAVVFYFVVKPKLEDRGVDVDTKLREYWSQTEKGAEQLSENAGKHLDKLKETGSEWMDKAADRKDAVVQKTEDLSESAQEKGEAVQQKVESASDEAEDWYDGGAVWSN